MADKCNVTSTGKKNGYNYGIDALRILAMFMVVTAHILGPGGILDSALPLSAQYGAAWFLEIAAYCSVNCYALISGYVGINAGYKYHNLILLWLRVVFCTFFITLFFSVFVPGTVSLTDWIKALLPVTANYYWYFSAYFALFFFIPLLNTAMNRLTRQQLGAVVVGLILVFSCLQTLSGKELFATASNAWWLMILYIIGGYIRKYGILPKTNALWMLPGYLSLVTLTWLFKLIIESEAFPFFKVFSENYLFNHTSPTILGASVFLLLLFERIDTPPLMNKIIRFLAPMAFSVYIIHAHPFTWDYFLSEKFSSYARLSVPLEIILVLLTAAVFYMVCSLLDLVRIAIFNRLKLKQRLAGLEKKYLGGLWN